MRMVIITMSSGDNSLFTKVVEFYLLLTRHCSHCFQCIRLLGKAGSDSACTSYAKRHLLMSLSFF